MLAVAKVDEKPGVKLIERPEPEITGGHDVIVEVGACGICGADVQFYNSAEDLILLMARQGWPRVMGHEIAGTVIEVGKDVVGFQQGDHVACEPSLACGSCYYCLRGQSNLCTTKFERTLGVNRDGGFARYVKADSRQIHKAPNSVSFEEAAMFEPLGVSLHAVELGHQKPGDTVVVIGPGPLGIIATMLMQLSGIKTPIVAGRQTSRDRLKIAAGLGAQTIEISGDNLVEKVQGLTDGLGADVVFDFAGGVDSLSEAMKVARKGGEIIVVGTGRDSQFSMIPIVRKELRILGSQGRVASTWQRAINLVGSRAIDLKKVITHSLPLEEYERGFRLLRDRKAMKVCLVPTRS